jgi:hypothetical protein
VRAMARYKMLVLSRPIEGREAEYNDWYQNTHLKQVVALPGYVSAQRFKRSVNMRGEDGYPYMALYEIEAADVEAAYKMLESAAGDGRIAVSQAFDYASVHASIYEPFGDVVSEEK